MRVSSFTVATDVEAGLLQRVHPLHHLLCRIDGFLRLAGIERGHIPGLQGRIGSCRLPELLAARGKRLYRHVLHLPHAVLAHHLCLIPELFHQGFQRLPVEFPEGCLVSVHILDKTRFTNRIGAERLPLVPVLRGIDNDGMGVQLRLLITVRIVVEFRHNQIAGQYRFAFSVRHDTGCRQSLQLFHG